MEERLVYIVWHFVGSNGISLHAIFDNEGKAQKACVDVGDCYTPVPLNTVYDTGIKALSTSLFKTAKGDFVNYEEYEERGKEDV